MYSLATVIAAPKYQSWKTLKGWVILLLRKGKKQTKKKTKDVNFFLVAECSDQSWNGGETQDHCGKDAVQNFKCKDIESEPDTE